MPAGTSSARKFIALGNFCIDIIPKGNQAGGTALYSAVAARKLGWSSLVVTNFADDYLSLNPSLEGFEVARQSAKSTTTFGISYDAEGARQISLVKLGEQLIIKGLGAKLSDASVLLFGPVANEYGTEFVEAAARYNPKALTVVAPQGWMRKWAYEGAPITAKAWDNANHVLPITDILVVSDEDISGSGAVLKDYVKLVGSRRKNHGVVVCTHGKLGATAYSGKSEIFAPAFRANAVDPTGAGDVFAAAFGIVYCESGNLVESLKFAHAAAAFAVEGHGTSGIAPRPKVENRALVKMNYPIAPRGGVSK